MRLCAGHSGTTLDILHGERRAADHSANIGSKRRLASFALKAVVQKVPQLERKRCDALREPQS